MTGVTAVTPLREANLEAGTSLLANDLAYAIDPVAFARACGYDLDPWQEELLREDPDYGLVTCSRQAGKSTVASIGVAHKAIYRPRSTILILSKAQRQSAEVLQKVRDLLSVIPNPPKVTGEGELHLRLANGSRVFAFPGSEGTVRGFTATHLVIDEAAQVSQALVTAVRPMLAVSGGKVWALSTPKGTTGWFYEAWTARGRAAWRRWMVPATDCPRIPADFLEREQAAMPVGAYRQEYLCSFEDPEGAVFSAADLLNMSDPEGIEW